MTNRATSHRPSASAGSARLSLVALATLAMARALEAADVERSLDVVVVVAAASPTAALGRSELADLFLGRVSQFPDGRPAVPIDHREGCAVRAEFNSEYLGRSAAQVKAHWSRVIFTGRGSPPRSVAGDDQLRRLIASDPTAIGYLERRLVDASLRIVRIE